MKYKAWKRGIVLILLVLTACDQSLDTDSVYYEESSDTDSDSDTVYTVYLHPNGGSEDTVTITTESTNYTIPTNTFSKTAYSFTGWNYQSDGSGVSCSEGDQIVLDEDEINLYAQWSLNSYSITFDANGGSGSMDNITIAANSSSTISDNEFTYEHNTFNSWNTSADGTGTSYEEGDSYTIGSSDITLYAQWDKIYFKSEWSVLAADGNTLNIPFAYNGNYDFEVDWGDGDIETITTDSIDDNAIEHFYDSEGNYTVLIYGTVEGFGYPCSEDSSEPLLGSLVDVTDWGDIQFHNYGYQFSESTVASFSASNVPDMSQITNISNMFSCCEYFNGDISAWDTSNIKDMEAMFKEAISFNGDISDWDTSSVTDMSDMFSDASSFNCGGISISTWEWNVDSVTDFDGMFEGSLLEGDEPDWYEES
ncbi:MAG: BspA family leucine-rich repeat surface protein [Spirochaetales bacterium]|nr:BspA family leucine-rich repeat surface protein [Spirochaetales bacterium]